MLRDIEREGGEGEKEGGREEGSKRTIELTEHVTEGGHGRSNVRRKLNGASNT